MRSACVWSFVLLSAFLCAAGAETVQAEISPMSGHGTGQARLVGDFSAPDVLFACREMMPSRPIELSGALVLRNRKGIVSREYSYRLVMRRSLDVSLLTIRLMPRGQTNELATVTISRRKDLKPSILLAKAGGEQKSVGSPLDRVMDTDVTWLDLTFDFLWWSDAAFEKEREGESVHGQTCAVILVHPPEKIAGLGAVRLWTDKKTGCLMQAEYLDEDMTPRRRLWGTRVKKFDDRWMVSVLEVETLGSRHRTKITVDSLKDVP